MEDKIGNRSHYKRRKIQQLKNTAHECILGNVAKWT